MSKIRAYWWVVRRFGLWRIVRYEWERIRREQRTGVKFDPRQHGEPLLRSLGASDEQIARAREAGLA